MSGPLTATEMRSIERAAIESGGVTGLDLMERAGRGVVEAVFEEWPGLSRERRTAVVFCGPGNNGGDGFVVARLLDERGWEVDVYLYGDPERLPQDARTNHDRWAATGPVHDIGEAEVRRRWACDLVVDALFGTGLTRPIEDLDTILTSIADAAAAREEGGAAAPWVVAVDLPSGIDTDTGRVLVPPRGEDGAAAANLTVTFHRPKRGHVSGEGPRRCGHLVVKDIGLWPWDPDGEAAR